MRLLTWNINALAGTVNNFNLKYGSFKGFLDAFKLDIFTVQEHKLSDSPKFTKELACIDGFESFWTFSKKKLGYSGVATWCKLGYAATQAEIECFGSDVDEFYGEGRVVVTDHGHFVLISVYVPNAGGRPQRGRLTTKLDFMRALIAKADALVAEGREVIICGDLNVAASKKDVHHEIIFENCYSAEELHLLDQLRTKYIDVWRHLHPDVDNVFTVWDEYTQARLENRGLRIDYILISPGLLDKVVSCEIFNTTPPKWSDHAGVLLELKDMEPTPDNGRPCALSSRRNKRFNDRTQPSIRSMFAPKKRAASEPAAPADSGSLVVDPAVTATSAAAAAAATRAAGASDEPAAKRQAAGQAQPASAPVAPESAATVCVATGPNDFGEPTVAQGAADDGTPADANGSAHTELEQQQGDQPAERASGSVLQAQPLSTARRLLTNPK